MLKQPNKINIKPRIFSMVSLLIIMIFLAVFLAFNIIINSYIKSNATSQLNDLILKFNQHEDKSMADRYKDLSDSSNQKKNNIGTHAEVLVIDLDYNILKYNSSSQMNELESIAHYLRSNDAPLSAINNSKIQTAAGDYYISIIADQKDANSFFVFLVNVASIKTFVETVNIILAILMGIALIICFGIANIITLSITKPINQLAKHAERLGQGDFSQNDFSFSDKEFYKLAETLNTTATKLEQYDKEQHTFFQNVSHELRTPLMSIQCHAEGISHNLMNAKKASDIILLETDKLSSLVEELLYISKLDTTSHSIDMQELDLRETLSSCAERFTSIAYKKNITFTFDFDDNPVLFIYNEKYLEQALNNLLSNALRYAKANIILHCKSTNIITLSITNDGICIAEKDLPHVFDRFYKGENGKHGIGLSIVKSIATLHGGYMEVHTNSKQTTFKMIF